MNQFSNSQRRQSLNKVGWKTDAKVAQRRKKEFKLFFSGEEHQLVPIGFYKLGMKGELIETKGIMRLHRAV